MNPATNSITTTSHSQEAGEKFLEERRGASALVAIVKSGGLILSEGVAIYLLDDVLNSAGQAVLSARESRDRSPNAHWRSPSGGSVWQFLRQQEPASRHPHRATG